MSWLAGRENVQYNIVQYYHRHSQYRTERLYRHPAHLISGSIIMKATVTLRAMRCVEKKTNNKVVGQSSLLFAVQTKYLQLIKSIKGLRFPFENYQKILLNY